MERDAATIERHVARLLDRCRDEGMNVTPQRVAIYRALVEASDHPSPEQLFERVRPQQPSLSLATIYKTLDALARLGLVREVALHGGTRRYDGNLARHHHLVCDRCASVEDVYDARLDAVAPPRRLDGFRPAEITVQVHGLCASCGASEDGRRPRG